MTAAPIIQVRDMKVAYGSNVVLDGFSLDIPRGEVIGIIGPSGGGKSVTLRAIVGLKQPESGRVEVFGEQLDLLSSEDRTALERRWGIMFQDGALFSSLTVIENVKVPLLEYYDLPLDLLDELALLKIRLAGLPADAAHKYPSQLSGGMRKRAGLARALALDPEILFLDEPTSGLDPIGAADFDALIRTLSAALGFSVFLVTHDLDSLYAICDRVAVLADGRVQVADRIEVVEAHPHPWIRACFTGPRGRSARAQTLATRS
jgi:phospholipid/cholesterol/gamma-HCH transport system ATP-binding protein